MEKKYQVFVSSTFEDLKEERATVITALLKAGYIPTCMEYFTATNKKQWDVIQEIIPQCDYYVVIVAGKYGSIEPESKISYTEKEYDLAMKSNVPVFAFLYKDIENLPNRMVEQDSIAKGNLNKFRKKLETNMADFWDNKDDLATKVLASLHKGTKSNPRIGWIRADNRVNLKEDYSFLNNVADIHIEHLQVTSFDEDPIIEKTIVSLQWGDILGEIGGKTTNPLTLQGFKDEISNLWEGIIESDVQLIINTFLSKGILEVGNSTVEGYGVQNYCIVTSTGYQVLAEYVAKKNEELSMRDHLMLIKIMNHFSARLMDNYLEKGPYYLSDDLLSSFESCKSIVSSSSFVFYGETLNAVWKPFYECWYEAMNHGEWYVYNRKGMYVFSGLECDLFVTEKDETNFNHLVDNCGKLQHCYVDFINYVKNTCKVNVEEYSTKFEQTLLETRRRFKL